MTVNAAYNEWKILYTNVEATEDIKFGYSTLFMVCQTDLKYVWCTFRRSTWSYPSICKYIRKKKLNEYSFSFNDDICDAIKNFLLVELISENFAKTSWFSFVKIL